MPHRCGGQIAHHGGGHHNGKYNGYNGIFLPEEEGKKININKNKEKAQRIEAKARLYFFSDFSYGTHELPPFFHKLTSFRGLTEKEIPV